MKISTKERSMAGRQKHFCHGKSSFNQEDGDQKAGQTMKNKIFFLIKSFLANRLFDI